MKINGIIIFVFILALILTVPLKSIPQILLDLLLFMGSLWVINMLLIKNKKFGSILT